MCLTDFYMELSGAWRFGKEDRYGCIVWRSVYAVYKDGSFLTRIPVRSCF